MEPLVVLRIRRVGDVSEATSGGYHVVGRVGEAQRAGHPRAVVVVAKSGLLLLHLLPRPLEVGFGGVEIHLPGLEARILLIEVGRVAGGAQIRRCEVRSIGGGSPVVDEKALAGGREVVDVVGVVLQAIPRENLKEVVQRGESVPATPERMTPRGASRPTRCSNLSWNVSAAFWIPYRRSRR